MRAFALLPALVLLVVGGVAAAQPGWTRLSYPDARFSVNMARAPAIATPAGTSSPTTTYSVAGGNETVILATNFGRELPDVKAAFNAAEAGRKADGGTVLSRRDFTFQGAPAMDLMFRTPTGVQIADRLIYRQGWLYQLMVSPSADATLPVWGQQFFDSFRFTD